MRTQVYKSEYFTIWVSVDSQLVEYEFNSKTEDMTADEYIDELKEFIGVVELYRPQKVFGEMTDFKFAITPDIQDWINENLFSVYRRINFQKIAIILSKEFVSELSIQQTMAEETTESFLTGYFDNEEKAKEWLFSN